MKMVPSIMMSWIQRLLSLDSGEGKNFGLSLYSFDKCSQLSVQGYAQVVILR